VIAIVDTGVDLSHPDLAANLWTGTGGVKGFDAIDSGSDPDDYEFHGTHVAGTAAASADNGIGIAGVAPNAQIMPVRALDGNGSGTSADIADGILFAAANGADVINLSFGRSGTDDSAMSTAITAAEAAEAVVVAAAGNDGENNDLQPTVPCSLPNANIICVAAVNQAGGIPGFSNFGTSSVDVGAPGTDILSAKTDYGAPLLADGFEPAAAAPPAPASAPALSAPRPATVALARPNLKRAKGVARVSRRGSFRYVLRATPGLRGQAILRTRVKVATSSGSSSLHASSASSASTAASASSSASPSATTTAAAPKPRSGSSCCPLAPRAERVTTSRCALGPSANV
jgi:subtilisin family serine protease